MASGGDVGHWSPTDHWILVMIWRNRIVGEGVEEAGQLAANPRNWRIHPLPQQDLLKRLFDRVGWVQRVIVNQRTGYVLDGHLRVQLALSQSEHTPVPVVYVDLSEDEEALVLATFDPISAMAVPDNEQLQALVEECGDMDFDLPFNSKLPDKLPPIIENVQPQPELVLRFSGGDADAVQTAFDTYGHQWKCATVEEFVLRCIADSVADVA